MESKISNHDVRQMVTDKNDQDLRKREVFEDGIKGNQKAEQIAKEIVDTSIEDTKNELTQINEQKGRGKNQSVWPRWTRDGK